MSLDYCAMLRAMVAIVAVLDRLQVDDRLVDLLGPGAHIATPAAPSALRNHWTYGNLLHACHGHSPSPK